MNRTILRAGLLVGLLFPAAAFAQDGFQGQFTLEGRTSTRRKTEAELKVSGTGSNLSVVRTGRYTSQQYASLPPFTWTSSDVRVDGRTMVVTFRVAAGDSAGLIAGLDPDRSWG